MRAIADSANWDFLATRLRARRTLVQMPSIEGRQGDVAAQTLAYLDELDTIRSRLDTTAGRLYTCFIDRFHLHNLLLVLQIRLNPARQRFLAPLLTNAPCLPAIRLEAMLQAATASQMTDLLLPGPSGRNLLPLLRQFDADTDLFQAESRLEALFYDGLLDACQTLPDDETALLLRLARGEIDLRNILLLLRSQALYHLPPDAVSALALKGGLFLKAEALPGLARLAERESLVTALPERYRDVIRRQGNAPLPAIGDALWSEQDRCVRQAFRDYTNPAISVLVYPFLRSHERLQGIRLAESRRMEDCRV